MADPLRRTTPGAARSGLLGLLLLMPAAAHATPCADIYKLAEVGVSGELLEKAINANAENMSEEVANCLEQLDVPFSVIKLVRDAAAESAASAGRDAASTSEAADARSAPAAAGATRSRCSRTTCSPTTRRCCSTCGTRRCATTRTASCSF